jgi:hypothetical protein
MIALVAVNVTEDHDFAVHRVPNPRPSVVWVRIGNTRLAGLMRRFAVELLTIVARARARRNAHHSRGRHAFKRTLVR